MKKLLFLIIIFLFNFKLVLAIDLENLSEATEELEEIQKEISDIKSSNSETAKTIDDAVKEINKATDFVKETLKSNNVEDAINTLEFIEKSLSDVTNLIPPKITSDMSEIDTEAFGEDKLNDVLSVTKSMNVKKEETLKDLITNMSEMQTKGLNVKEITSNLKDLGIETIEIKGIDVAKMEEMKTWDKNQWANSYTGSILTNAGEEVITDKEISLKVVELEDKFQKNTLKIQNKRSELSLLNNQLNPISSELESLNEKKSLLTSQYNLEILKLSNSSLSNLDTQKSKELAENLNKNINSVTDEIKKIESISSELQSDISKLNFEINTERDTLNIILFELANSQKELNSTNALISSKELKLDRLLNTDLSQTNQKLNQQLNQVSLQKDFIQSQFEKSIDLEVEALQRYHSALGETAEDIDFAIREVGVILDGDPRKARAFELEKYATYAGLSKDYIQKGIDAVNNDDWDTQKQYYKDITKSLAKNPNWVVDVPSNAEFNVMIAEEQAIQEAAMIAMEGQKIKSQVDSIINQRIEDFNKNNELTKFSADVFKNHSERMFHKGSYSGYSGQITNEYKQLFENEVKDLLSASDKQEFEYNLVKIEKYNIAKASGKYDTWSQAAWDDYRVFSTAQSKSSNLITSVGKEAKDNLISKITNLENQIDEITKSEIAKADGYNYAEDINKILDKIPTFDSAKRGRVNLVLTGGAWYQGDEAAALRAALGEQSDYEAYQEAVKAMSEMGEAPVSEYMTGPYWEMSNVKAAAIVRSKKYDYVDDYEYINAYYRDPLQLNTTQRQEVEAELKNVLGNNNPKLNTLTKQANALKAEIETNNVQLSNINSNISELENEISSIKSSEANLKNQISKLNNDLKSKEDIIKNNTSSILKIQKQIDPLNSQIETLENQKVSLNENFNKDLAELSSQIEKTTEPDSAGIDKLKADFESQISSLNEEINNFESQAKVLNSTVTALNEEIKSIEVETPEIATQITQLHEDIKDFTNIKADLAIAEARKANMEIEDKLVSLIAQLENKSVIKISGSDTLRIVDTNLLTDNAGNFKVKNTLTVNGNVYTAGAVQPQHLFSFENIDETGDMKIEYSKEAIARLTDEAKEIDNTTKASNSSLGSWVLIDVKTGKQMVNPNNGYQGSIVCEASMCGSQGSFGRAAAQRGNSYVRTNRTDGY